MTIKTKKARAALWQAINPFTPEERLRRLRKARGILKGKGPKNIVAWQRRMRKDRKIIK